jgi:hypothetical protein
MLPGFRIAQMATVPGFCTSIVVDSHGTIYYTVTQGGVYRLDPVAGSTPTAYTSTQIAQMPTEFIGNAGLLGMALLDDSTAAVHYTTSAPGTYGPAYEVISKVDLVSGAETVMASLPDDITGPGRPVSGEHHGGNPTIGDNGSVWVGIGEFGTYYPAEDDAWWGGKILRVDPDGTVTKVAKGFRNPYGIAWDKANKRLIVSDNGDGPDDEMNIVTAAGGDYGWPCTMGNEPPCLMNPNTVRPIYSFPKIVAPTGLTKLSGSNSYMHSGYLLATFVTKAVCYFPDIDVRPLPDPISLVEEETAALIDVTGGPNGEVYFVSGAAIYRLSMPQRGDCNGDGAVDIRDLDALTRELADGDPHSTITAQNGSFAGSWGCDANGDGLISAADRSALASLLRLRMRAVRVGH